MKDTQSAAELVAACKADLADMGATGDPEVDKILSLMEAAAPIIDKLPQDYPPKIVVRLNDDGYPEITLTGQIDDLIAMSIALTAQLAVEYTDDPANNIIAMASTALQLAAELEGNDNED